MPVRSDYKAKPVIVAGDDPSSSPLDQPDPFLVGFRDCCLQTIEFLLDHEQMEHDHPVILDILQLLASRVKMAASADGGVDVIGDVTYDDDDATTSEPNLDSTSSSDPMITDDDEVVLLPVADDFNRQRSPAGEILSTAAADAYISTDSSFEMDDVLAPLLEQLSEAGSPDGERRLTTREYARALALSLMDGEPIAGELLAELFVLADDCDDR